ncbi:MAG TPA: class I poly(R)-hydroxyalkanoic acid synthase [Hyphomicrobiaceae bacterium]|nr:class I poly(R)-hydroxyalkanoic acid synthase [Hyphomicrobiaceae bacterium]
MQKKAPDTAKPVPVAVDFSAYQISNPEEFGRNMLLLLEEGSQVLSGFLERANGKVGPLSTASELTDAAKLFIEVAQSWAGDPIKLAETQGELVRDYLQLAGATTQRLMGVEVPPVAEPEPGDNRFKDPEWEHNPYFDFCKQTYLITMRWLDEVLQKTDGLDERTRQRAEFYLKQLGSALSPSNFPITNPEVLRETFATSGKNLVQGMANLVRDMERSGDVFSITQTDLDAFEVGRNVATAPGKVIFQNDLLQLIQYEPTTQKVHEVPLLIVPPWINKFYILDLSPQKSFIRYMVSQGFTVFVVSWVNPDQRLAHKTFEDYMTEGILAATEAVRRETGCDKTNVIGYCVGGTLLGTTLAYLAARGEDPFESATFFAAQVDFTKAGDLLLFIDDAQLKSLEEMMAERGFLDGSRMATVFNMLRPKDLIWPYIVNNYMLGKKPFPFDLLFWNQDSTRMTPANHTFYLREFYHENKLARGQMSIGGVKLDLGKVKLPIYELCAKEDHIAPAKSVFIGSRLFGGPVTYVLSGSGHIAGVINPPGEKMKYQYWTNDKRAATLEAWFEGAREHPGSWWPHYAQWLGEHSRQMVPARKPGTRLGVIESAPGSYVKVKG